MGEILKNVGETKNGREKETKKGEKLKNRGET